MRPRDWLLLPATVVVAGVGTIWGSHYTSVAVRNRAPVELSCAELLRHPPDAAWLRLTGCALDLDHYGVRSSLQKLRDGTELRTTTALYIPVRAEGERAVRPAHLVVLVDDPSMLELQAAADPRLAFDLSGAVEGLVQDRLDLDEHRRAELKHMDLRLADDFAILRRGDRPRPLGLALGELAAGLGALGLLIRRYRRWARRRPVRPPKATVVRGG